MDSLGGRYRRLKDLIPSTVTFIAVSKGQPTSAIRELYGLGHRDFGENYVQELLEKARELQSDCPEIRWHFIGHLQSNKIKTLLPLVHSVQSIDSLKLAGEISTRATQILGQNRRIPCFLEVNIDEEESKSGFAPLDAPEAAREISKLPGIDLRGLMCIPAHSHDSGSIQNSFRKLRTLEISCHPATKGEISMGMSEDFEVAIAEGSTMVRIGTKLFGPRNYPLKANT